MYLNDLFTIPGSLAGNCSVSVPAGFAAAEGGRAGRVALPVGVQFVCDAYREDTLLRVAKAFEDIEKK